MISPETRAQIRRYYYAEHWKIGTIAREMGIHPEAVRNAVELQRLGVRQPLRPSMVDPYVEFIRQILEQHPGLRATRVYQMVRERGYTGSVVQLRRAVTRLRPKTREAFLRLAMFPGEQAQVDWAHFGHVLVGRAHRALSCFVMTLSYSRALYLEFFFDQTTENFMRGHVHAFESWGGQPRAILYDNLKSAVLERRGSQIIFNPQLIELSGHYHFGTQPCQVRASNQKGRVERAIRYVRDSFWAGRTFTTLTDCNRQAWLWRDQVAHQRRWPGEDGRSVAQAFAEEQTRLLPLPLHPFNTDRIETARSHKSIYVRFDLNDYSIPPEAVGRPLTLLASDTTVRILDGAPEIAERARRSLERRLRRSGIKRFKPMADFEWSWPTKIERDIVERALTLDFLPEARNLVLVGRNGLGKTMIAQNICHAAVLAGYSVLFRSAAALLEELHRQSPEGRRSKLRTYSNVGLLCIDEVGYLSFDDKAADLLYEVVNRRYERKPVILTTNRPFKEWNEVFPNATCIVTLLDRLLHHADVTVIEGNSYRVRESEQETAARRRKK